MTADNAFFHRGPIRDPAYFFGRDTETAQVLSLLCNGQSVSMVGQRRIGKTSLLFHLANPAVVQAHGLDPAQHLFVYLDCGGWSTLPPAEMYQFLLEEVADALPPEAVADFEPPRAPLTYRAFERSLRRLTKQGWRPIFLLDEFERLSLNPALDPDFFSGLRAVAARYPIAYVTASKTPLLELTYANASALSSPFFNIFAGLRLGLFSEPTARRLLVELAAKSATAFSESLLNFLLTLAGPHPLLLQIAGFHAVELIRQREGDVSDSDLPDLQRRFIAAVAKHFSYYWRNLSPDAQRLLATLPTGGSNRAATLGGWALMVSKYSSRPDAAARLVQLLAGPEGQNQGALVAGFLPTIEALYRNPEVLAAQPHMADLLPVVQSAVARPSTVTGAQYAEVSAAYYNHVHRILTGEVTAAEGVANLEAELIDITGFEAKKP